ncbi:MAG: hypothetical protein ACI8ZN_001917 [Bacteroidia bacterium]|jgi:hypothetical protein
MNEETKNKWKRRAPFMIPLVIAGMALLVYVVMRLWNGILPEVIGVGTITYWQTLGILILSKILFGGSKFGSSKHSSKGPGMARKFSGMSIEDKAAFKQEMKARWCSDDESSSQDTISDE